MACQAHRSWDANGARWTGNEVAQAFRVRARTVSDVRPCRTIEGFERLASFRGRRSSSAEDSLAWPRIRDERAREAHRDLQIWAVLRWAGCKRTKSCLTGPFQFRSVHGTCGTARAGEVTARTRGLWSMRSEMAAGASGISVLQRWLGGG